MLKNSCLFFAFLFIFTNGLGITRYWVGGATGNYSVSTNWNTQSNGSGSFGTPTNIDDIVIGTNSTIILDGNYAPSSLYIINNATVAFSASAARTYTIGGGSVAPAFKIESGSTLQIQGSAAITLAMYFSAAEIFGTLDFSGVNSKMNYDNGIGSGTTTIKSGGQIRYGGSSGNGTGSRATFFMDAGSTYEIYKNGGTFPTGTYHPQSLILNTGATTSPALFLMNASVGSYGNYEFNSPLNTNSTSGFNQNISFNNFSITNDGSGKWVYSTSTINPYTLTINGDLNIASSNTLDINRAASGSWSCVVFVKGNISIQGELTESGANTESVLELGGSASSTINLAAAALTNDINVKVNKSGGVILALSDVNLPSSINAKLIFVSGCINSKIYNKEVFVSNPSTFAVINGSAASHIVGRMKRATNQLFVPYEFPVSDNETQWAKALITPSSSDATNWSVEFVSPNSFASSGLTPGVIDVVSNYYWNISKTGNSDMAYLNLFYNGLTQSTVAIPNQLKVLRLNNSVWQNLGGTPSTGSVENNLGTSGGAAPLDPIASFGQFAIGGVVNTLPVSLLYFKGKANVDANLLHWMVACSSVNGVEFDLQRSVDGIRFESIHRFYTPSNLCEKEFTYADNRLNGGKLYYRLQMKDNDGKSSYSQIISLNRSGLLHGISNVYPNPYHEGKITASIVSPRSEKGMLYVIDGLGRGVHSQSVQLSIGENFLSFNGENLTSGTFRLIFISSSGQISSLSLLKK
jgi:hypothetical protein